MFNIVERKKQILGMYSVITIILFLYNNIISTLTQRLNILMTDDSQFVLGTLKTKVRTYTKSLFPAYIVSYVE